MMGDDTQRKIFFTYLGQKGREIKDHTDARELLNASNRPTWPELDPSVLAYFEYWDDAGKNLGITGKPETDFKRGITRALSVAIGVARSARGIGPDEVVPMSAVRALEPEALQKLVGSDALRLVFGIGGPGPDELPAQ